MKTIYLLPLIALFTFACANEEARDRDFHTSGSKEADQRAEQRIAKDQQLKGEQADVPTSEKRSLYVRLGGEAGVDKLVSDWIDRAMADPSVNWKREGVTKGGVLGVGDKPVTWEATASTVAKLKKHIAQFIAVRTGGPARYDGKEMKSTHADMKISNDQFDASVGDLKATLDAHRIPVDEQKELLAVIESTRTQIVEQR